MAIPAQRSKQQANTPTLKQVLKDTELFSRVFLKILNKDDLLLPLRLKPAQRHYILNQGKRDLILKARQMGFSTVIQADYFKDEITRTCRTLTLSHEAETTNRFRRMVDRFYKNFPEPRPRREYNNSGFTTYPDFDSEAMIATAGNKNTGRGGSVSRFHGSEVGFWPDAKALIAGAMQGGNPRAVLESTPNGAQGWFYTACMEALDGNSEWKLFFYPWWWDEEYREPLDEGEVIIFTAEETELVLKHNLTPEQIKWRRKKQRELKNLFIQEYPEDALTCFLRSGLGYFGDLFTLKAFDTNPGEITPDATHRYVAGLDWGQMNDWTVLSIVDADLRRQVAMLRINQREWGDMRNEIKLWCDKWGVSFIWAEKNSIGSVNIEELHKLGLPVAPFDMGNESKASIMGALHEALYSGFKLLNEEHVKHEFGAFTAKQLPSGKWQLKAPDVEGEHDDVVIATALAHHAILGGGSKTDIW